MAKSTTNREICLLGLMTALLCVISPFSIPLLGMVPISLCTLIIYLITYLLGTRRAFICCAVYLVIGCVGLPVFSGFSGGFAKLLGPTGGYMIGYFAIVLFQGELAKRFSNSVLSNLIGMTLGTAVCYALGTTWLCFVQKIGFISGLFAGVIPFLTGDIIKIAAVCIIAPSILRRLRSAGLLP